MKTIHVAVCLATLCAVGAIAGICTHLGCGGTGSHEHWYTVSHNRYNICDSGAYQTVSPFIPCSCTWPEVCHACSNTEG